MSFTFASSPVTGVFFNFKDFGTNSILWQFTKGASATALNLLNKSTGNNLIFSDGGTGVDSNILNDQGNFTIAGSWILNPTNHIPFTFGPVNTNVDQSAKIFAAKRSAGTFNTFNVLSWNGFTANNNINIGGNSGAAAAATGIFFFSAANIDTAGGTQMCHVDINGFTMDSGTINNYQRPSISTISATTLTQSQSGILVNVSQAAAYQITIPTVATGLSGVSYKFILNSAASNAVTIKPATGTTFQGNVIQPTGNVVATNNGGTITFVSGTARGGDWVELTCNGLVWVVLASSTANGGITIA